MWSHRRHCRSNKLRGVSLDPRGLSLHPSSHSRPRLCHILLSMKLVIFSCFHTKLAVAIKVYGVRVKEKRYNKDLGPFEGHFAIDMMKGF